MRYLWIILLQWDFTFCVYYLVSCSKKKNIPSIEPPQVIGEVIINDTTKYHMNKDIAPAWIKILVDPISTSSSSYCNSSSNNSIAKRITSIKNYFEEEETTKKENDNEISETNNYTDSITSSGCGSSRSRSITKESTSYHFILYSRADVNQGFYFINNSKLHKLPPPGNKNDNYNYENATNKLKLTQLDLSLNYVSNLLLLLLLLLNKT